MSGKKRRRTGQATTQELTVQKRPLLRPAIPSKYANASVQKVVYVSSKMPFMAAVKRVNKLLDAADKRDAQSALASVRASSRKGKRKSGEMIELDETAYELAAAKERVGNQDEVVMKGTGKAIEKTLGLALFFQQRDEYCVKIRTGSVAAIDDIVEKYEPDIVEGAGGEQMEKDGAEHDDGTEMPSSRVRYTSMIEVSVSKA